MKASSSSRMSFVTTLANVILVTFVVTVLLGSIAFTVGAMLTVFTAAPALPAPAGSDVASLVAALDQTADMREVALFGVLALNTGDFFACGMLLGAFSALFLHILTSRGSVAALGILVFLAGVVASIVVNNRTELLNHAVKTSLCPALAHAFVATPSEAAARFFVGEGSFACPKAPLVAAIQGADKTAANNAMLLLMTPDKRL